MALAVFRRSTQLSQRFVRAFAAAPEGDLVPCQLSGHLDAFKLSETESAAGHGKVTPWHYTVPSDWRDTRTELNKAQHRGETPDYDKTKGVQRKGDRLNGIWPLDKEAYHEKVNSMKDEDGVLIPPHCKELPAMSYKDTLVNYHFDYLGLKSPPFGEAEISEIESKTTISRDNIHHARHEWINLDVDMIDMDATVYDLIEMYKKGVSYRTINLWLDYMTGSGSLYKDSIRNLNWTRIDS